MCQSKAAGGRRCALHHPGTRAVIAATRAGHDLDRRQGDAVFRKAHAKAKDSSRDPSQAQWEEFLDTQIQSVALNQFVDSNDYDRTARKLNTAKAHLPDGRTFAAIKDMDQRMTKAASAIRRQVNSAAALRGVSEHQLRERYEAYRRQYLSDFAALPDDERPDPPASWVTGFTTKDMMAVSTPADAATLYAIYRCQADPDAFPTDPTVRVVSIDLETAGPAGKEGFDPVNGSIIEVGLIEYDLDGNEVDRYEQLVAPACEVAAVCGTGAVEIHQITLEDVADAPDWDTVAPVVADRLKGRVLLAQNARFEQTWLEHHLGTQAQEFDRWGPTVDTMCLAKQHLTLANHRLSTICETLGVDYTNGHRAMHDANVAAQAFFAMRTQIFATYNESPSRRAAPQPVLGFGTRVRTTKGLVRLSAADFSPTTVVDPWALPAAQPTTLSA